MAEIDFDELDQAVTSLMKDATGMKSVVSQAPDDNQQPSEPSESPLEIKETEPVSVPEETLTPPPTPTETPRSASVATRRRGQFMDVMHPSADMRKPTASPSTASPSIDSVARHNTIIQPSASFTQAVEAAAPATPPSLAPVVAEAPVASSADDSWPDPIDFGKPAADAAPETIVEEEKSLPSGEELDQTATTTPFLSDAKVEKRPLGAPALVAEPDSATEPEPLVEPTMLANTDTPIDAPIPAELGKDVMNVESAEVMPHTSPAPVTPVQPIAESDTSEPAGPSSIPPQYHTSDAPQTEPEHASMYATDHQDLASPAKKKSGWLIPVIILVLLILGGAGGYLAYSLHIFG